MKPTLRLVDLLLVGVCALVVPTVSAAKEAPTPTAGAEHVDPRRWSDQPFASATATTMTDPRPTGSIPVPTPATGAVEGLGLRGSIEAAVVTSNQIRAARLDHTAAEYRVWRQLSAFTPAVSASLSQGFEDGITSGDRDARFGALNLTMPLFTSGQRLANVRSARSTARAEEFRALAIRDRVTLDMAEAYLQQSYAIIGEAAVGRSEQTTRRLLRSLRAQHAKGFVSGSDVAEVAAELKAIEKQMVEFRALRQKAATTTNSLAGRQVAASSGFPRLDEALSPGREQLRISALRRNPNILVASNTAQASFETSRAAIAGHLPQVGLNAEYRRFLDNVQNGDERDRWNVGVKLTVPLVDLSTVASIGESRSRAAADRYRAQDTRRTVGEQFDNLWEDYASSVERERISRQQIDALKKVNASAHARFVKGLVGLDVLLDSQRQLMAAEIDLAQLKTQKVLAAVQILVTAGIFQTSMLK